MKQWYELSAHDIARAMALEEMGLEIEPLGAVGN